MLPEKGYKRTLVIVLYTALIALSCFISYKYIIPSLLPFLISFSLITLTRPITDYFSQKLTISKKLASATLTIIIISITFCFVYFAISRLLREIITLVSFLADGGLTEFLEILSEKVISLLKKFPGGNLGNVLSKSIGQKIINADKTLLKLAGSFYPKLVEKTMQFISLFPMTIIFTLLTLISMFYIGYDYEKITAFLSAQFSGKSKKFISTLKNQLFKTIKDLLRAYLFLTLITFFELLTGFLILKVKYAVLLAIIISFVDMLPVFGTGTILVPWSIISLILGNNILCVGLLVLYGIITVFRQILEPKVVGSSIGLHPLIQLIAMYSGVKIIGFWGIFIFPIVAIVIKSLNEQGVIKLYKNVPKSGADIIENSRLKYAKFKSGKK